jgi:hypothetical protein
MESFTLTVDGDVIVVHGRRHRNQSVDKLSPRGFWQLFRSSEHDDWESIELRYTPDELSHMDDEARSKRGEHGTPDAHSLSQIVRAVGAVVDQKEGRLISIRKDEQSVEIQYDSALKRKITEVFTAPMLYDYWVRMYLKRSDRLDIE